MSASSQTRQADSTQARARSTCAVNLYSVTSSSGAVVFVEQAARTITALDVPGRHGDHVDGAIGRSLPEPLMGPDLAVADDELDRRRVNWPSVRIRSDRHQPTGSPLRAWIAADTRDNLMEHVGPDIDGMVRRAADRAAWIGFQTGAFWAISGRICIQRHPIGLSTCRS
jgi:hypothetical protein